MTRHTLHGLLFEAVKYFSRQRVRKISNQLKMKKKKYKFTQTLSCVLLYRPERVTVQNLQECSTFLRFFPSLKMIYYLNNFQLITSIYNCSYIAR